MALKITPSVKSVSKIVCDKLSVTIDYKNEKDRLQLIAQLNDLSQQSEMVYQFKKWPYQYGLRVREPDIKNRLLMLIQWKPVLQGMGFFRVDFNPAHADMSNVFAVLDAVLPGGYADLKAFGKITRFDASVDLSNIRPDGLLAYYPKKQISQIHCKSGKIETLYLGKRGEGNLVVIYDKQREIKEKNQKYKLDIPELKIKTTRVEIRMHPDCNFENFLKIENPFSNLDLKSEFGYFEDEELWRLFIATCRHRGEVDALALLDSETRKKFRSRILAMPCSWWQPNLIWIDWPSVVNNIFESPKSSLVLT